MAPIILCTERWAKNFLASATAAISSAFKPSKRAVGSTLSSSDPSRGGGVGEILRGKRLLDSEGVRDEDRNHVDARVRLDALRDFTSYRRKSKTSYSDR